MSTLIISVVYQKVGLYFFYTFLGTDLKERGSEEGEKEGQGAGRGRRGRKEGGREREKGKEEGRGGR